MNQVLVHVRVRGVFKQEGEAWVAGFPRLDIYSQGDSADEAKDNASEALRLWFDSCLDRGTLGDALRELGWHRNPDASEPSAASHSEDVETVDVIHLEDALGEPWEQEIEIPAYQAAAFQAAAAH